MHVRIAFALVAAFAVWPAPSEAALCGVCDAVSMCDVNEVCADGIPETGGMTGRCAAECPNPNATFGGCPSQYACVPFGDGVRRCVPRSDDCTNLPGFVERGLGQACTTQSCVSGALCLDGSCRATCTAFGPGNGCPGGQFCGSIGLPTNPFFVCGNAVGEAAVCNTGDVCTVGLCLNDGTTTQCYRNCGPGTPTSSCGGGQTCDNIPLNGGASVDLCMPPQMGGPSPDAGVVFPDAFVPPNSDANVPVNLDAFVPSPDANGFADASVAPGDDAALQPGQDASAMASDGPAAADTGIRRATGGGGGGSGSRASGCSSTGDSTFAAMLLVLGLALARRRA